MKTPADFRNQDEWLDYLRATVAVEDILYRRALGRTDMFRSFYEMRSQPFPVHFGFEIDRIVGLADPFRTNELEALNDAIFADMCQFLFTAAAGSSNERDNPYTKTPREVIEELSTHLRIKNLYFALWTHYKEDISQSEGAPGWRDYVAGEMGSGDQAEAEFALLISELGNCLDLYHQREMTLPRHFYFHIWLLHHQHGPERNVMTRALVQELVEGLESCASA